MNKKLVLLAATLIFSASIYAASEDFREKNRGEKNDNKSQIECCEKSDFHSKKFEKLTDEQKTNIKTILKKYSLEKEKVRIELREKKIAVDKLLLDEKIDWQKVEKALTDESISYSKIKLLKLKEQKEISQITGEEIYHQTNKRGQHKKR